ncbi:RBR-type E3 ubiquitin transferase [Quillaja saponaria]|uniref:RBR-type E3 ubiquitin transferase n=1 Tax=Quillaja saponaria TaxID=32244 RepID=A0AAD7PEN5_QUISA|nr:RBR-type E3 ubiquitin transferase [Quillaja saponaria]
MAQESAFDLLAVDDFYFSALFDENKEGILNFPVSDDKYAEELQLQEVLVASAITSQMTNNSPFPTPSSLPSTPIIQNSLIPQKQDQDDLVVSTTETGESSQILCEICVESKGSDQMFKNERCVHSFCSDCITKHVATKIQDSVTIVSCPGLDCKGVLELDACKPVLSKEVLDRWDEALYEAFILTIPKFYCPFKDCSAMLVDDNEGEVIRESECPVCHRLFCARCNVPWHPETECEEFQRMNEDEKGREDLQVRVLASEKKWRRCPQCKFYVEKTEGCLHITCRCQYQFCYGCGDQWTQTHGGCQGD